MQNGRFTVEKIRSEYTEREPSKVEELKALDASVKRPIKVFSYIFGSVGALVMGSGMSLVMTDIAAKLGMELAMPIGIVVGVVGLAMSAVNYPVYKVLLKKRRKKYADKIIALSDSIEFNVQ